MSETTNGIKCDSCGRFMKCDAEGNSGLFVPDTHFTHEESVDWCAACTKKQVRSEAKEMAAAIMEAIRKVDPRYAEGGEFYDPPDGDRVEDLE